MGGDRTRLSPTRYWFYVAVSAMFVLFHINVAINQTPQPLARRGVHLGVGFAMLFIRYRTRTRFRLVNLALDGVLVLTLFFYAFHLFRVGPGLPMRAGIIYDYEILLGVVVIGLVLEATRRTLGWGLPLMAGVALVYAFAGVVLPGVWGHGGYSVKRIVGHLFLGFDGLLGAPTGASVNYIFLFLLFAAILEQLGTSEALGRLATGLIGHVRGGAAKISVIGSSLFGMITGSAVANAASVGPFSIPLMRRGRIDGRMAASVESVSSVGGQLVPPVMGSSAFIMAEFLGVPFSTIVIAAILPAILYYAATFLMVDFYAAKHGLQGLSKVEIRAARSGFWRRSYLLTPLAAIVLFVGVLQISPSRSALYAIAVSLPVGLLNPEVRRGVSTRLREMVTQAADLVLPIVAAVACAGVIVGVLTLTGLGNKLSSALVALSGGNLLILLILTMLAAVVVGAGLPTVPTYVVLVVLLSPALQELGVEALTAHLFILYYGVLADLTPPTAATVVVAASIARENPWRTMFTATRVGMFGYIVPFIFVYYPEILLQGEGGSGQVVFALVAATIAIAAAAAVAEGWFGRPLSPVARLALAAAIPVSLLHGVVTTVVAAAILGAVWTLARLSASGRWPNRVPAFHRTLSRLSEESVPSADPSVSASGQVNG